MFDDLDKEETLANNQNGGKNGPAQPNAPIVPPVPGGNPAGKNELEDILAGADDGPQPAAPLNVNRVKPPVLQPKAETGSRLGDTGDDGGARTGKLHKLIVPLSLVAILLLLGVGGVWGYRYLMAMIAPSSLDTLNSDIPLVPDDTNTPKAPVEPAVVPPQTVPDEQVVTPEPVEPAVPATNSTTPADNGQDRDKDGLTDAEEIQLGTDVNNVDSDEDGLFDREEVKVYKTDPLNPDTDGDGYKDGEEVSAGYNPNGDGKLYEIKQ